LLQNSISYSSKSGKIKSADRIWDHEMNDILNLNHGLISYNRKEALEGVIKILDKRKWTAAEVQNELQKWESYDNNGKYKQYCGIIITFLKKKK
jgi:hypothetical protein